MGVIIFTDSTFKPWQILCKEEDYIQAVVWALSNNGGRLWSQTKNDIFIVDPHGKIESNVLKAKLLEDDWAKENISKHVHDRPYFGKGESILLKTKNLLTLLSLTEKKLFVITSFGRIQGYEAETVVTVGVVNT